MSGWNLEQLQRAIPSLELTAEPDVLASHGRDWTRFWSPQPAAVVFPREVQQIQALVRFAVERRLPLVPSGGRTGLSGGAVAAHGELLVSFDRMCRIVDFSAADRTVTVEAGVVTAEVQRVAADNGLHYPVAFAADGSSQIGGNIATNAGGVKVLRYGLTRDWVTGLKVVTGAGELLSLNRGLIKDASGYDLRHLFIGSEGTLGMIVEATLQLTGPPPAQSVMLLGLDRLDALMQVFDLARLHLTLSAFEFFTDRALARVADAHGLSLPMDSRCPLYCLLEFDNPGGAGEADALRVFEQALENGWVADGVISQSDAQARDLWRYREGISESIASATPYKNDLSVRISQVPDFLAKLDLLIEREYPDFEVIWFGHIGDGNLHMNVLKPPQMAVEAFEAACERVNQLVFDLVKRFGGSISAEHGLGLLKQPWLPYCRSDTEIALMRQLKHAFDPAGIMNPGKLLGIERSDGA